MSMLTRAGTIRKHKIRMILPIIFVVAFLALSVLSLLQARAFNDLQADRAKRISAATIANQKRDAAIAGLSTSVNALRGQVDRCKDKRANTPGCQVPVAPPPAVTVQGAVGATGPAGPPGASPTDSQLASLIALYCSAHDDCRGIPGINGSNGANGADGGTGPPGPAGQDGKDGTNGTNGTDGISVTNVQVNDQCHLIVTLSNDSTIDAGQVCSLIGP